MVQGGDLGVSEQALRPLNALENGEDIVTGLASLYVVVQCSRVRVTVYGGHRKG